MIKRADVSHTYHTMDHTCLLRNLLRKDNLQCRFQWLRSHPCRSFPGNLFLSEDGWMFMCASLIWSFFFYKKKTTMSAALCSGTNTNTFAWGGCTTCSPPWGPNTPYTLTIKQNDKSCSICKDFPGSAVMNREGRWHDWIQSVFPQHSSICICIFPWCLTVCLQRYWY